MPTDNQAMDTPKLEPLVVERNGVELEFEGIVLTKGENKGQSFYSIPKRGVSKDKLRTLADWLGFEEMMETFVIPQLQKRTRTWHEEAIDEDTGEFKPDEFRELAQTISPRGETKAELQAQLTKLATEDFLEAETEEEINAIRSKIRRLKDAIDSKKRERKTESDKQPVAA